MPTPSETDACPPAIRQEISGDHNIVTGSGDINITYQLPPAAAEDHRNLTILAERVNAFWVEGVLEQMTPGGLIHQLEKQPQRDAIEHPWESVVELPGQTARVLKRDESVSRLFSEVGRSLLILGEPGSGKTVTLLELARDLIASFRADPGQAVPVVLNLSSWAGQAMDAWLVEELKTKYFIPARIGRPLLVGNRLVLLLDGLDEVAAQKQANCVEAINRFTEEFGVPGLAVCSRSGEYISLPVRLKLHCAVRLNPLTSEQIDQYLSAEPSEHEALRAALAADPELKSLAQSPLILSVMGVAFHGRSGEELLAQDRVDSRGRLEQVFNAYTSRMFERGGTSDRDHDQRKSETWLEELAQRMLKHGQSVFLIEQLQPSWLDDPGQRLRHALVSRIAVGLILGLTEGLYLGITGLMGHGLAMEIPRGLVLGLLFGMSIGFFDWLRMERSMKHKTERRRQRFLSVLASFPIYFLGFAVPFVVLNALYVNLFEREGFGARAAFGLIWALVFALRVQPSAAQGDIRAVEALSWSWRRCFKGMILGLGIGIALNAILFFAIGFDRSVNVDRYSIYPLLAMAGYMILGGIFGGLAAAMVETKTVPNEGIQLSLRNARFAGLVVGGAIALLTPLYIRGPDIILGGSPMLGVWGTLIFSGIVGLYFGILAALWYGGIDVIYHWILARTLGRSGILPRHLHAFLDHASRLSILQRVGGGYIFVHRLLLEHFAKRGRSLPIPGAAK